MDADKAKARELFAQAYSLDPMFQPVWGRRSRRARPAELPGSSARSALRPSGSAGPHVLYWNSFWTKLSLLMSE